MIYCAPAAIAAVQRALACAVSTSRVSPVSVVLVMAKTVCAFSSAAFKDKGSLRSAEISSAPLVARS